MDLGIMYAIVAFVCAMMDAIVLNRTRSTAYKETIDEDFCNMLYFFIGFSLVDGIWGLFMSRTLGQNALGFEIFSYGFHGMAALSAFMWSGYMVKYTRASEHERRMLKIIRISLLAVQFYVFISNFWNHAAFTVTKAAEYVTGPMRTVMFILQFAYYVILSIYAIIHLIAKNRDVALFKTGIVFCAIPVIFGLAQLAFPDAAMYSLGFTFIAVCIFSFNVTHQREQFLASSFEKEKNKLNAVVAGLSEDVQSIYYVDLVSGQYENFNNSAFYAQKVLKQLQGGTDFFRDNLQDIETVIHPDDQAMVKSMLSREHMLRELEEKQSYSFNYRMALGGDFLYYMIKVIRPTGTDAGNKVIVGVFDDDERIRAEMQQQEQLEEARRTAEAANQAKSTFLFNMSHDIRTPMNAIIGFTGMAQKHMGEPERLQDCLNKVESASTHLLQLINDVLDMARIESGRMEIDETPTNVRAGTEMIAPIIQEEAEKKGITFRYEYVNLRDEDVFSDYLHVNQILMNLLSNAVKYTRSGGRVDYTIEQVPDADEDHVTYRFIVADNGIGMSEEYVKHIFEEFSREASSTKSGVEGTGLGMSIVKQLVDKMGGSIEIQSAIGVGTTVTVCLRFRKVKDGGRMASSASVDTDDRSRLEGKRVLLVEDNELNREIAGDTLEELGLLVEEADDGSVAVELVGKNPPDHYDAVLMDVQMPYMDGYKATQTIRALRGGAYSALPIIAMTANAFEEDRRNAIAAGMNDHLSKPIDVAKLVTTLEKYIK